MEFNPYTLTEYNHIKPNKYYELGGLGPINVGTDEWIKKKEMQDRKLQYSKQVNTAHSNNLPKKEEKAVIKPKSKMEIAIEFAKAIPKPVIKTKSPEKEVKEKPPLKLNSQLQTQLDKHEEYRLKIQEIKALLL